MKIAVMGGIRRIKEINRVFKSDIEIAVYIDNDPLMWGKMIEGKKVYSPYDFPRSIIDRIVIFIYDHAAVDQELIDLGIDAGKIIDFNDQSVDLLVYEDIFEQDVADRLRLLFRIDYMDKKIKALEDCHQYFEQNYLYEAVGKLRNGEIRLPKIHSVEETYEKIIADRCSLSRYGDGEFEIILGNRAVYQQEDRRLAERLKDILMSDLDGHIIAIADDYGTMEGLRCENRNVIRKYMTEGKRCEHYALLDMDKEYFNAYISRPYVIYPIEEKERAKKRFDALKRIWDKQEILFVEGDKTRMGVGNDLFSNADRVERIIAPNENAFRVYDEIYDAVIKYGHNKLILIALGPTATVLAYDLAR